MSFTLADLRSEVRRRADQENSRFISDTELNSYINQSYAELYDLLVSRFADYFMTQVSFTLTTTSTYALPSDFYKLLGVDYQSGSDWVTVGQWTFSERNSRNRVYNRLANGINRISYRVMGANLRLLPENDTAGSYRLWYIPRFTALTADADIMSNVLDFIEYVICDAAIKCLVKEESDPSAVMAMKQTQIARINTMAADRDAGMPQRISDVSSMNIGIHDLF